MISEKTNDKITAEILYQFLILRVLIKLGGAVERTDVLSQIRLYYSNWLSKIDLEDYESGHGERWKNHISFAREHLKEQGYLRKDSPRGIWEITNEGREKYKGYLAIIRENKGTNKD